LLPPPLACKATGHTLQVRGANEERPAEAAETRPARRPKKPDENAATRFMTGCEDRRRWQEQFTKYSGVARS
jgi:hypothetical protein